MTDFDHDMCVGPHYDDGQVRKTAKQWLKKGESMKKAKWRFSSCVYCVKAICPHCYEEAAGSTYTKPHEGTLMECNKCNKQFELGKQE